MRTPARKMRGFLITITRTGRLARRSSHRSDVAGAYWVKLCYFGTSIVTLFTVHKKLGHVWVAEPSIPRKLPEEPSDKDGSIHRFLRLRGILIPMSDTSHTKRRGTNIRHNP